MRQRSSWHHAPETLGDTILDLDPDSKGTIRDTTPRWLRRVRYPVSEGVSDRFANAGAVDFTSTVRAYEK